MIEFVKNYTEKFINNTPERNFHYDLINQYGPWVANVSNKDDVNLIIAAPKMAEYMMDKAQELHLFLKDKWLADYPTSRAELDKILSILKDAGIDIVKDGKR